MRRIHGLAVCAWGLMLAASASAGDWPSFRGPNGQGIAEGERVPLTWSATENVEWRFELPGPGNSSPIVSNGRVFVTCATDKGRERSLYCLDRNDGKLLWTKTIYFPTAEKTHKTNPFCGSTPAADGERVVVWHGSAGLFCYDFDGNELWSRDLGDVQHIWGYGSSPIIHKDKVYLNFGPGVETFVAAVDLNTGVLRWKTEEPGGNNDRSGRMTGSWSTPVVIQVDGADQILCSMSTRVVAYDPEDGRILWTVGGVNGTKGDLCYTSPVVNGNVGLVMAGFNGPSLGFKLGGSGDVTETNRLWREDKRQPQRIGSGVVIGDHVFTANAGPGTIQCIELDTGRIVWQVRPGASYWGSPVLADGRLYVTDQDGTTRVFEADPEKFVLLASNELGESSNSTPAISNGELFLRTFEAVYCIGDAEE